MRPISLTVEGFSCFKARETVSFDGLDLFAIWGPTGAGKTSLLDAMIFALYGSIPRLGEKRNRDIISLTRDKAVVLLEFSIGPDKYRLVRTAKRTGGPEAKLEDGDGNLLAEGVRSVEAEIRRRLGLPYEAFIQAVVLPQGEFQRFLRSEPRDRRNILRDLLRLDIYERMRGMAEQRRAALEGELSVLTRVLEDYADVTPDNLEALQTSLKQAREQQENTHTTLTALVTEMRGLEQLHDKTLEIYRLRDHLKQLDMQDTRMRKGMEQIEAAERASIVMPDVARVEQAQQMAANEQMAVREAEEQVKKRQEDYEHAKKATDGAAQEAGQVAALRTRIRALDGIRGVLEAKVGAERRLTQANHYLGGVGEDLRTGTDELEKLRRTFAWLEAEVSSAERQLELVAFDKELDDLAQQVFELANQLAGARETAKNRCQEAERAEVDAADATVNTEQKAGELEEARLDHRRALEALGRTQATLDEVHQRHAAVILRRSLRPGEPCPVCDQPLTALPRPIAEPELDGITKEHRRAGKQEQDARRRVEVFVAEHGNLRGRVHQLTEAAQRAKASAEESTTTVAALEAELIKRVAGRFDVERGATAEERALSAASRFARARTQHSQVSEQLTELNRRRDVAAMAIEGKEAEISRLDESMGRARDQVAGITGELKRLEGQVRRVTTHPDPVMESNELQQQVERLENLLDEVRRALTEAQLSLATAEEIVQDATERAAAANERAKELLLAAKEAVKRAGFASIEDATSAVISLDQLVSLREAVDAYKLDRRTTEEQLANLAKELRGREIPEAEIVNARGKLERAHEHHDAAVAAVARLDEQTQRLQERLERRKQFDADLERLNYELVIYRELAEDLRNDRFQEFVLEEAFDDLVRGASDRLIDLTGRYRLKYRRGEILVVDHDNADELRSADTLSGGETFLASLSLALELSEQIQQAAGAVLLDSLFIDEGFGTLDPEALDSVASAIESLRGGGRMVGIITHIRDLADRLPCRIEVDRGADGSRVHVQFS